MVHEEVKRRYRYICTCTQDIHTYMCVHIFLHFTQLQAYMYSIVHVLTYYSINTTRYHIKTNAGDSGDSSSCTRCWTVPSTWSGIWYRYWHQVLNTCSAARMVYMYVSSQVHHQSHTRFEDPIPALFCLVPGIDTR